MKVLVTGANGFIGTALCKRILSEGWDLRGSVRSKANISGLTDVVETGAIGPNTNWEGALEGVDTVVHLVARAHIIKYSQSDHLAACRYVNVTGTEKLARFAAVKGVKRFVYLSTVKVNGEGKSVPYTENDKPAPSDPYGISKYEAEMVLKKIANDTGLSIVILRSPLVYGPGVKANFLILLKAVSLGCPLPFAKARNLRSLIFLDNLTDALLACIYHPKATDKTFLVSDGDDVSTSELIRRIAAAFEKPSRLFPLPAWLIRQAASIIGKAEFADKLLDCLVIDSSKIRKELNWIPRFSMVEGLAETVKWFRTEFG